MTYYCFIKKSSKIAIILSIIYSGSSIADSATATQTIEIIIPKVALIDTSSSQKSIAMAFDPIGNAGNNFATADAVGIFDVTSNISRLKLYAHTDKNLKSNYNLSLKVKETNGFGGGFKELGAQAVKISTLGKQAQKKQRLYYEASPASSNQTIPYGDINVKVTYTLVEP